MWAFTVVLVVGLKSACLICRFEDPWFPGLWERHAQVSEHQTIGLRVAHSSTCGQERVLSGLCRDACDTAAVAIAGHQLQVKPARAESRLPRASCAAVPKCIVDMF